ncbi:hypothetical protein HHK36_008671 [Tetracentron sinense]|uniref:AIG1-type G domain-containing protein n=1 Tax=Tetracentron sinense TaxID=13715 RepID=A0A834ZJY3_TETSI|nr:hypothetical protein HHK36_008671 [Tetracentron sinense]
MENGVEIADISHLGETNAVVGGISQETVGDRVVRGFHESKDSEGDVFEEAMDVHPEDICTQENLQEHPGNPDLEEVNLNGDENSEGARDFDSLEVNVSSNGVHEADNFEEAIDLPLPIEDRGHEEEKPIVVEDLVAAEPVDEVEVADGVVDEENNAKKDAPVELKSDGMVDNGDSKVKESSTAGETKHLMDSNKVDGSCDVILNKSRNGVLDKVKLEEMPVIRVKLENGDDSKMKADEIELSQRNESNEQNLHQDDKKGELNDNFSNLYTEHEDDKSGELKDTSANLDTEHQDDENWELKGASAGLHIPVDEGTETSQIRSSPPVEYSTAVNNEKIKADATEIKVMDFKDLQFQVFDEDIAEGWRDRAEAEKPGDQQKQGEGEKHRSKEIREPEIQPVADVVLSTGNSMDPAPPPRPAGLGRAAPLLEPAPRASQQSRVNAAIPQRQAHLVEDPTNGEAEENDETREKLQMIRVKFLRLAHRLGQTPHNVVVAQVLYRLGLAEQLRGRNGGRVGAFSFDRASAMAEQLEAAGQEPLDFSCTIMVLGKTGVGKSATINSIFDEVKFSTDAFQLGTTKVQDVVGTVQGIRVRVIDTPGLLPSCSDQRQNEKILHSVKRFIKKTPPDIVLYLDRLDMQSRDFGDMPLLRTITEIFGPSIWFNAIVVLTHAASAPPDGPNGTASSYDMFVTQRSHVVQQAIRQAAGDMRLMNPVSLVENHSACRTNRAGQRVLPNGQVWKPHLLLLSFASKILAEANTLLKLQDSPPGKPFATRSRAPPLPFLLSSLLQSRPQLKLPEEQFGDDDMLDDDADDVSDSDDESDYDELPPFKRLTKAQLAKLTKAQKKAYFDELEYREKLFMKKQLKEEKKRRKLMKKMEALAKDLPSDFRENVEEESGGAASVPVPMPDLALPTSFDSDNPTHRYRYLDSSNQWLVRPVLETHGWDHDIGYEGINVERLFVVKDKIPLSFSGQVTKDKKESNLQMELVSTVKHGEGKATSLALDMQTVGKDMAYTLRSETRFNNFRHNNTAAGLSVTLLGDALTAGVKLEDKLIVNKRFRLVMTGGAMTGRGDVAYGGSLEATLRDEDYPLGRMLSTLGLSIMDWRGDLAIGCNLQSQFPIGRSTNMIARANLNNRGAGQVSIRLNSSEQLQIALIGLVPLLRKLLGYSQQIQFGQ